MSSAIMTLIGLYNYDHTLFDGLSNLPADVDKGLLVDTIIMRGGEYEVLYPNPDLLKSLISSWSTRYYPVVSNWLKAQEDIADINPLENYDRYENWTDTGTSQSATHDVMSGSGNTSGTDNTSGNASTSGTDTVSAFDSNTLVNDKGTSQTNTTQTASTTSTSSQTATTTDATVNGNTSGTHTGHTHGNIGVTTAGTMYREFLDVIGKYGNIYESIATIFLQSFVIPLV